MNRRVLNTTLYVECMASCTAITHLNNELVGDPLDVKMFEATGWQLDENDQSLADPEGIDQIVIGYVYPKVSDDMQFASAGSYNSR